MKNDYIELQSMVNYEVGEEMSRAQKSIRERLSSGIERKTNGCQTIGYTPWGTPDKNHCMNPHVTHYKPEIIDVESQEKLDLADIVENNQWRKRA